MCPQLYLNYHGNRRTSVAGFKQIVGEATYAKRNSIAYQGQSVMPRPNFFILGAPKCGTTSLQAYLAQHPDVFMCSPKEPRFYDDDLPSAQGSCIRDRVQYKRLFDAAGSASVIGEASPSYLLSNVAADRIYNDSPDAKLLVSLRNPVDFMESLHRQLISSCNEDLCDFAEALNAEEERSRGHRVPKHAHYPAHLLYRKNARFSEQLQRYYGRFNHDQIKVVLMEDLAAKPEEVFSGVLSFLGIDLGFKPDFVRHNVGAAKKLRNFRVRRWLKDRPGVRRLFGVLPSSLRGFVGSASALIANDTVDARRKMPQSLRRQLLEEFAPEVDKLSRMIGRDLSHWGHEETVS